MSTDNAARKSIPGRDANLPPFIVERMEMLGMRPTLTQLAMLSGVGLTTLRRNMNGENEMKFSTASRLACALDIAIDDLATNVPFLVQ